MTEASKETLRRYLAIPPEERLKVVEDNLAALVNHLLKDEAPAIDIVLPVPAVLLDIVRVLRKHEAPSGQDSGPKTNGKVESPTQLVIETMPYEGPGS